MRPFQRDAPTPETEKEVEEISRALARPEDDEYRRMLGRRGDLLRVLGRTAEAIADLEAAVRMAREADDEQARAWNLVRLGTARQYAGDHKRAVGDLSDAVSAARVLGRRDIEGYARQHLGKCLVECGRFAEAREHFEVAREIRTALDDQIRLASTHRAIRAVERLLAVRDD